MLNTPSLVVADAQVDQAACVLRLLYLKELRQLQTAIDDAIVGVQVNYVPSPCCNAAADLRFCCALLTVIEL